MDEDEVVDLVGDETTCLRDDLSLHTHVSGDACRME